MYSKTSDSGHFEIGIQYNKPLNKGQGQKIDVPIVLIQLSCQEEDKLSTMSFVQRFDCILYMYSGTSHSIGNHQHVHVHIIKMFTVRGVHVYTHRGRNKLTVGGASLQNYISRTAMIMYIV